MSQPIKSRVTSRSEPGKKKNAAIPSPIEKNKRGRPQMMRTGIGIFLNRARNSSISFLGAGMSVLAFGDEPRRGAQHVAFGAEDRQRGVGLGEQVAHALFGAVDPELGDEGGFAQGGVLPGLLAERCRVALDVEQIVGDLEGLAERMAVIVERLMLCRRGLPEDRAGDAAIAEQRAGLHLLQAGDVDRLTVAEPALAGEIEYLAADHAADSRGPRQRPRQQQAYGGISMDFVAGDDVEGERQ